MFVGTHVYTLAYVHTPTYTHTPMAHTHVYAHALYTGLHARDREAVRPLNTELHRGRGPAQQVGP